MAWSRQQQTTFVPPESFARTYDGRAYDDPWKAVTEYRRVVQWYDEHDEGARAISRRFDIPRGRVDGWISGSQPQAVRGLETAIGRGWIDVEADSDRFRGLNALVSWLILAGSIAADTWAPYFSAGGRLDERYLDAAGELAGLELDFTRASSAVSTREMRPIQDGSVLGRVLAVLGAPVGGERPDADYQFPDYLSSAPRRVRREFVQLHVHHLGRDEDGRIYVQLRTQDSQEYVGALAELIRELTGEMASTIDRNVVLSTPASRAVAVWEPLVGVEQGEG